ncbi:MAG TPA: hypothetical protein VMS73_01670 [Anaerolineaceae bacterium]|nr:hypothetical protein [Anaerolineaceae bacterium]
MLKRVGIILISIFVVAGIVALIEAQPTFSFSQTSQTDSINPVPSGQTDSEQTLTKTPKIQVVEMTLTPTSIISPTTSSNTPTHSSLTEENIDPNILIARLKILTDTFANSTLKAGWLHLSNEYYQYDDHSAGTLSNGVAIPKAYVLEEFYHIDGGNKLVFEGVTFMKTLDGKVIQAKLFRNNVFKDLITTEPDVQVEPFLPILDGGVTSDFSRLALAGLANSQNKIEETSLDGVPVTQFDISLMYDKPMKFANYEQAVYGIEKRAYISSDGKLVELDVFNFYQNGTEILAGSSKNFIVEILLDLPIEIQQYMK